MLIFYLLTLLCASMSRKRIQRGRSLLLCYGNKSLTIDMPRFLWTLSQTKLRVATLAVSRYNHLVQSDSYFHALLFSNQWICSGSANESNRAQFEVRTLCSGIFYWFFRTRWCITRLVLTSTEWPSKWSGMLTNRSVRDHLF